MPGPVQPAVSPVAATERDPTEWNTLEGLYGRSSVGTGLIDSASNLVYANASLAHHLGGPLPSEPGSPAPPLLLKLLDRPEEHSVVLHPGSPSLHIRVEPVRRPDGTAGWLVQLGPVRQGSHPEPIDLIPALAIEIDASGRVRWMNEAARGVLPLREGDRADRLLGFLTNSEGFDLLGGLAAGVVSTRFHRISLRFGAAQRWFDAKLLRPGPSGEGMLLFAYEVTQYQKLTEDALRRAGLDGLIAKMSIDFATASQEDADQVIDLTLETVGSYLGVDRSYVFNFDWTAELMDNTHEWCAEGIEPAKHLLQRLPLSDFDWALTHLQRFEVINVPRVSALPPEASAEREILELQGIRSLLLTPIISEGRLLGMVGYDAVQAEREWPEETALILQLLANAVGAFSLRNQRLEQIQLHTARTRAIVESALDAIVAMDSEGRIHEFNASAERMFGYPAAEVVGRTVAETIVPADQRTAHVAGIARFRNSGESQMLGQRLEMTAMRSDGTELPVEIAITRTRTAGGPTLFIAHISDISERKAAQAAMEAARRLAEESAETRRKFLAAISHEMRTPLNGVLGLSHLLGATKLAEDQREFLDGIQSSADLLLSLIEDALDFVKIDAGKLRFEQKPFRPAKAVEEVVAPFRLQIESRDLRIHSRVDPDLPRWVLGDPVRFKQILLNLLSNAAKFTEHGEIWIELEPGSEPGLLRGRVADTGRGISAERLPTIFEPFVQELHSGTPQFPGSGLGLSIVQELIERQAGSITVSSRVGEGTTFLFELPLPGCSAPTDSGTDIDAPEAGLLTGARLLIVEDNPLNQLVASRILEAAGATTTLVEDGAAALRALESQPFDVVLMDLQMPGMDGFTATEHIRRDDRTSPDLLPVVALTASCLEEDRTRAREVGMDGFILKPFDPDLLVREVARHHARVREFRLERAGVTSDRTDIEDRLPLMDSDHPALIDEVTLLASALGDTGFAEELLERFTEEAARTATDLARVPTSSTDELMKLAHRLKSGARWVGAQPLAETAERLEAAARTGKDDKSIVLLHSQLLDQIHRTLDVARQRSPQPARNARNQRQED